MADFFESEELKVAANKISDAINKVNGKLRIAMLPPGTQAPIPEPRGLVQILVQYKTLMLEMQRDIILLTSVVRAVTMGWKEENYKAIHEVIAEDVQRQVDAILKSAEAQPQVKSRLLMPDGSPAPSEN